MIVLGVTLFLGTAGLAIRSPDVIHLIPFTLAVLASLGCLFFKAYRGIFFGFYVTLGVIILAFILFYFIVDAIHLYPTHSPRAGI